MTVYVNNKLAVCLNAVNADRLLVSDDDSSEETVLSEDADELSLVVSLFVLSLLSVEELSVKLLSFLPSVTELVFCDEQAEADVRIDAQASIAAVNLIFNFIVCPFFMRGKYITEYIIPTYFL